MSLDLSLLDQLGEGEGAGPKLKRFTPRAKTRPVLRNNDAKAGKSETPAVQEDASQKLQQQQEKKATIIAPNAEASIASKPTDKAKLSSPVVPGPGPLILFTGAAEATPSGKALAEPSEARPSGEASAEPAGLDKAIVTREDNSDPLATQSEGTGKALVKRRKGSGRGKVYATANKRKSLEEKANEKLYPGIDPIKKFVGRAKAQELLRAAEARKRKAEAAGEQEPVLAIEYPAQSASAAVQMGLDEDGNFIVNDQSLEVQAQAGLSSLPVKAYSSLVNNRSYSNFRPTARWKADETEVFYRALHLLGCNFSMMEKLIKGRSRQELKNKYHKEERENPQRINEALRGGDNLAVMQQLCESLQDSQAAGEVEDFGIEASQLFGIGPPQPGDETEDDKAEEEEPPKAAKKQRFLPAPKKKAAQEKKSSYRKGSRKAIPEKSVPPELSASQEKSAKAKRSTKTAAAPSHKQETKESVGVRKSTRVRKTVLPPTALLSDGGPEISD